ncbi:nuclease-related domain-containing protein [Sporosarcina sp. CAU 1771]
MTLAILRKQPIILEAIPRLIARLNERDPIAQELEGDYHRVKSGYGGEREADRHLSKTHFGGPVEILTDVELQISPSNFIQIDTLIMTTSFIFVLEIKNISGTLEFLDQPPRLQRTLDDGAVHFFNCPAYQLEKNMLDLDVWLETNGFPLKSSGAIILAYSKTNVKIPPVHTPIYYAKQLPQVVREQSANPNIMSPNQLRQIANKIRNSQRPFNPFPLCSHFRINPAALNPGLYCKGCHAKLIRTTRRTWECTRFGVRRWIITRIKAM